MVNDVNTTDADEATILRLIQSSKSARGSGRNEEADQLLTRAAQAAPSHPAVLNELGLLMLNRGEAAKARELFSRATQADPGHPALWSNLAASLDALGLLNEEMDALDRALALDPRHLASMLQKAALIEARGGVHNAARAYRAALATLPSGAPAPVAVRDSVEHARAAVRADDASLAAALDQRLAQVRGLHGGGAFRRVDRCIDLLTGRRRRYESRPGLLYFPEIPAVDFFETDAFPWLAGVEAVVAEVRQELTTVLITDRAGLEPYVAYPEGVPLDQWRALNKSLRWSAYFFWKLGADFPAHLARCPRTVAALEAAPRWDMPGVGPNAYFSLLDPKTEIPAHTGISNARLTVHVPLIVPPDCGLRVGAETREWIAGKAIVFDDTIEYESWNRSDSPLALLAFDIWNPHLSAAERDFVRATTEVLGAYYRETPGGPA